MACDEIVVERLRKALARRKGITEKRMFGGVAFLLHGNMCCGVNKDLLVLRVGPAQAEAALRERHVRRMDFTGRPMKGWIMVVPKGYEDDKALRDWVTMAHTFVSTLPKK